MIQIQKSHLPAAAITHPGMKGKNNEDRYAVTAFQLGAHNHTPSVLAVLSDGIGGHRAGEVASEMAVNLITQYLAASDGSEPSVTLSQAVSNASARIFQDSQLDTERSGMGATCACAWIIGQNLYAATVGDSRIYLVRSEKIYQLSTDHTWVQEAIELGILKPENVPGHPNSHIIRRYLGSPEPPNVDLRLRMHTHESDSEAVNNQGMRLKAGDHLLLCSDGLTDLVRDEEILEAVRQNPQQKAIEVLVNMANERGGHDNITIVSVKVPTGNTIPLPERWPSLAVAGIAVLILAVLVGAGTGLWFWYGSSNLAAGNTPQASQTHAMTAPFSQVGTEGTQPQAQPSATLVQPTVIPSRPTLPPPGGAGNGPTFTPWPTNTVLPTYTPIPTETPPASTPSGG